MCAPQASRELGQPGVRAETPELAADVVCRGVGGVSDAARCVGAVGTQIGPLSRQTGKPQTNGIWDLQTANQSRFAPCKLQTARRRRRKVQTHVKPQTSMHQKDLQTANQPRKLSCKPQTKRRQFAVTGAIDEWA